MPIVIRKRKAPVRVFFTFTTSSYSFGKASRFLKSFMRLALII